ncbi:hypothetical protein N7492_003176 [Penicillium capsulatum]|uniref:Rhodopsin domain-containing protein n=1 Tax=Penicillium capsulatum TaxID=69766 RepID=A0A9W9LVV7_9EURO|nr:hypothetical protein N7492_003176 [Penicillium capsulatum]KAJ6122235.1 hypothetical protein N7512_004700 [Penicillium capsulatum]
MGDSNTQSLLGVSIAFFILSFITVGARCWVRLRLVRAFGWDDATMVAALALNLAFTICCVIGYEYGLGRKLDYFDTRPQDFRHALLAWWLGQLFYVMACIVVKLSIIIALLRIAYCRTHRWVLYTAMLVSAAVGIVFFFCSMFQCSPVSFFWGRSDPDGQCLPAGGILAVAYIYSVGAAVTDLTIGIFPIFLLSNLFMDRRSKIAIIAILSLGCAAGIAVIVRIPFIHHIKDAEFLHNTSSISILSNIETGLGITAGSLPVLRPLVAHVFNKTQSTSGRHQRMTATAQPSNKGSFGPLGPSSGGSGYSIVDDEYHAALADRK